MPLRGPLAPRVVAGKHCSREAQLPALSSANLKPVATPLSQDQGATQVSESQQGPEKMLRSHLFVACLCVFGIKAKERAAAPDVGEQCLWEARA